MESRPQHGVPCQPCAMAFPLLRIQVATPPEWSDATSAALATAGLHRDDGAALGVAVAPGRVVLPRVDAWSAASRPHLLVGVRPHAVEVGPWVVPGVGPCARCVEAGTLDVGEAAPLPGVDAALLAIAAGWAAREVHRWQRGDTPLTWGTSWRLDHDPVPQPRRWERHPYCGCSWFESA